MGGIAVVVLGPRRNPRPPGVGPCGGWGPSGGWGGSETLVMSNAPSPKRSRRPGRPPNSPLKNKQKIRSSAVSGGGGASPATTPPPQGEGGGYLGQDVQHCLARTHTVGCLQHHELAPFCAIGVLHTRKQRAFGFAVILWRGAHASAGRNRPCVRDAVHCTNAGSCTGVLGLGSGCFLPNGGGVIWDTHPARILTTFPVGKMDFYCLLARHLEEGGSTVSQSVS